MPWVVPFIPHGRSLRASAHTQASPQRILAGMLYAIAVILILLWLVGLMSSATLGGFIHVLFVVAVIIILVGVITGRRSI
jgi:VIT1/CCC1 family predicted Fe2+/Mn2+ transporter